MKKRILLKCVSILFFTSLIIVHPAGALVNKINLQYSINSVGNILYVGGSGGDNYTKIQDAIDDAVDGDTVFVYDYSSPYYELLVIDKSINLVGEDRDSTVIDGNYKGTVVDIQADGVMITGFTIKECFKANDWQYNVINIINCENVVIQDNIISVGPEPWFKPWFAGVFLKDSSNNIIQDNIIFDDSGAGRTTGITIYWGSTFNNNISGNEIYGYVKGIYLFSNDNVIYGNDIHHNSDGIDNHGVGNKIINNIVTFNPSEGISNDNDKNTLISGNTITNNGGGGEFDCGISLFGLYGGNSYITNNYISNNNPTGIHFLADNNHITDNHISNNKLGLYADYGYYNIISRNNFIDNEKNAYFFAESPWKNKNTWNKNYWGDSIFPGLFPKIIRGDGFFFIFGFPWINIDWHPAKEPYDIGILN